MNQFSALIKKEKVSQLTDFLNEHHFILSNGQNILLSGKKEGCSISLYASLKLVIQGKDTERYVKLLTDLTLITVNEQIVSSKAINSSSVTNMLLPRIGSDESGKGDYFGSLVTAAVYVDDQAQELFQKIGVKDSKTLSDRVIRSLAYQIRANSLAVSVPIGPVRYNELYVQMRNLNKMLGWGHARAIENILEKRDCHWAVADQFGDESFINNALFKKGKRINLKQMPKAESDIAVAAASIVARDEFVTRLSQLSKMVGIQLPKGASSHVVSTGIEIAKRFGLDKLKEIAKWHFKTTEQIQAAIK